MGKEPRVHPHEYPTHNHQLRRTAMYRVFIPNLNRWIENIPVTEALVYKEEGYLVERMS